MRVVPSRQDRRNYGRALRSALTSNDPTREIAGKIVVPDSHGAKRLVQARGKVAETTMLAQQLSSIRGESAPAIHISSDGSTSPPPKVAIPKGGGGGAAADVDKGGAPEVEIKDKKIKKDKPVGVLSEAYTELVDGDKFMLLGPHRLGDRRGVIEVEEFKKKAPRGCLEVWCSSHDNPWALCRSKGKAGHTTKDQGAHKVPVNFRTTGSSPLAPHGRGRGSWLHSFGVAASRPSLLRPRLGWFLLGLALGCAGVVVGASGVLAP